MPAAISTRQLGVTFPARWRQPAIPALLPLDLDVAPGAILGVLGPNGSGKTTLLRVLAGLQRPGTGTATILGLPSDAPALRTRVAWQPEGPPPLPVLTGLELLQWYGCQLGLDNGTADARAARWLERFALQGAARRAVRTYSTGMQRRLLLAAALLGEPEVLLLDEPTSGLDPIGSELVMTALQERAAAGTAIVMASHHLQEVEQLCTEVLMLVDGRCALRGTLDELLATGERALVVRGLPDAAVHAVGDAVRRSGGELVRTEPLRTHVNALFRRLLGGDRGAGDAAGGDGP
ncbi:MAG: ABC transporter ATP-binding protein [Planctomycetota bacterium]